MKINTKFLLILLTLSGCMIQISLSNEEFQAVEIKPRVAHIQNNFDKIIRPLVERPFLPQEVDNLALVNSKRKNFYDDIMTSAQIVGNPIPNKGIESPSIYSTLIDKHSTSVIHPVPQPFNVRAPNKEASFIFSSDGSVSTSDSVSMENSKHMEIPVNFGNINNGPTHSGDYETPVYTGAKVPTPQIGNSDVSNSNFIEKNSISSENSKYNQSIEDSVHADIKTFLNQFENTKDKTDKIKVMLDGKARLFSEAKELRDIISQDIAELLESKKLAIRLNNLVSKYEKKMIDDQKARSLKLADEITLKDLLKDKMHRELQGIRAAPDEYIELDQVNPDDIVMVANSIKNKIGGY